MALPKLFQRIFWHNNTTPAINEDNLNAMSKGLSDVDDRVISLAGTIMEDVPQIQEDIADLQEAEATFNAAIQSAQNAATNAQNSANAAAGSVTSAQQKALIAEGWAKGTQNGSPVSQSSPYWENNAEYWAGKARSFTPEGYQDLVDDVDSLKETLTGEVVDSEPYVLRQGLGNLADMALVGGSVAWNQLCNGSSVTVPNGHKYYMRKSGTTSIGASTGSAITGLTSETDNVIDLTALFGSSTIADYIYSLEQATAGAGVAWFRKYFPNVYYGYQSGKIENVNVASRKVTGKNLNATKYTSGLNQGVQFTVNQDGTVSIQRVSTGSSDAYVQYTSFVAPFTGQVKLTGGVSSAAYAYGFDDNLGSRPYTDSTMSAIQTPSEGNVNADNESSFFMIKGNTYHVVLRVSAAFTGAGVFKPMIRLASDPDSTFEPPTEYSYSLDPSLQLRGIPKLVDNKLSYDGDIYTADGTVTRKYGIVDLGTLTWNYDSANTRFYADKSDIIVKAADYSYGILCAKYAVDASPINGQTVDKTIARYTSGNIKRIYIVDKSYTDLATFKTAMSGVYLVYELATPTTENANAYQNPQRAFIDGTEEFIDAGVTAGTRDVSIPVGNNTTYQLNETLPPTEDYVDGAVKFRAAISALGTDESGRTTASRAYTTGEFFYKDGKMYKVLTSIAQGATFTINTNCQQTTLFAELKALAQ